MLGERITAATALPVTARVKTMDLMDACKQWASRPDDERFAGLEEMHADAVRDVAECQAMALAPGETPTVVPVGDPSNTQGMTMRLDIGGGRSVDVAPTNYAFGQVASLAGAPAAYLQTLPAGLAATCINHGLSSRSYDDQRHHPLSLYLRTHGDVTQARAVTTTLYERITDADLIARCIRLRDGGSWRVPPARPAHPDQPGARIATEADCLGDDGFGLSIRPGMTIAPAGLYRGDRDMFVFMVDPTKSADDGTGQRMSRGFFMQNSEVGASAFRLTLFLYQHVCGNHIVWGASGVREVKIKHVGGKARMAHIGQAMAGMLTFDSSDRDLLDAEAVMQAARGTILGSDEESVTVELSKVRTLRSVPLSTFKTGYQTAERTRERLETGAPGHQAEPGSVWGMVQGLTNAARSRAHAASRADLDAVAGKVLQLAA